MARSRCLAAGRRLAGLVVFAALLSSGAASAVGVVSLEAPSGLQPLLEKHLGFIGEKSGDELLFGELMHK